MSCPSPRTALRVSLVGLMSSLVLSLAAPSPTRAEPRTGTADAAEVEFQLGNKAYVAGRYDQALSHYFESHRLSPNLNVLFNVAGCYEAQEAWVEAYRYYQEHATNVAPDNAVRPQSQAALARLASRVALLDVATAAPNATIYLERRDLGAYGVAPRLVPVKPGRYTVLLEAAGFEPWQVTGVIAELGRTTRVEAEMVRLMGELEVVGVPTGAEVVARFADQVVTGTLPAVLAVGEGEVRVEVHAPGHITGRWTVPVVARQRARLDAVLLAQTGALIVSADETGALVRLDGEPAGFTPTVLDRVLVGRHELAVEVPGYKTYRTFVEVAADARVEVRAVLAISDEVLAASRFGESVDEAPASVTLVPGLELRAFGAVHIADALRGVRGLYTSDDSLYISSGFRGFSPFGDYGNRVLVQLDGHTLNEDWYGSSMIGFEGLAAVDMLDRIEVVRGPGSTLHGSGSLFGVLNLVTRDEVPETGGEIRVGAVGPHTARLAFDVGAPFEDGSALVWGGLVYEQPGPYLSPTRVGSDEAPDGVAQGVGETFAGTTHAKLRWRSLTLHGFFHQRDRQVPTAPFGALFGDDRTQVIDSRAFAELRFEPRLATDLTLLARLDWDLSRYEADYAYSEDDGGVLSETFSGQSLGLESRLVWQPSEALRLTAGLAWRYHFENDAFGTSEGEPDAPYLSEEHPFHKTSVFGLVDAELAPWLTLSAGLRFDGIFVSALSDPDGEVADESFLTLNPRLALLVRPTEHQTIKVLLGRAFRAPSIGELTYNDGGFTQVPSPGVSPETAYTAELELTQRLGKGFELVVGAFLTSIGDLIQITGGGDEADPFRYVNQDDAVWSTGAEIELRRQFQQGLMFSLSYSGQRTRVGPLDGDGRLPNSPTHLLAARAVFPIVGRDLSFTTRLGVESGRVDRNGDETQAAVLLDVGLWGQRLDSGLEYGLWIRNLLDWDLAHPVGEEVEDAVVKQPGRYFTATVGYRF